MNLRVDPRNPTALGKLLAGFVFGLSLATAVTVRPVDVPVAGIVPSYVVGGFGVAVAAGLLWGVGRLDPGGGCGCSGDCDCA